MWGLASIAAAVSIMSTFWIYWRKKSERSYFSWGVEWRRSRWWGGGGGVDETLAAVQVQGFKWRVQLFKHRLGHGVEAEQKTDIKIKRQRRRGGRRGESRGERVTQVEG